LIKSSTKIEVVVDIGDKIVMIGKKDVTGQ
jgi:hypothetical protein